MSGSATRTVTFTIADARYVGGKIGADLHILNALYGKPPLADIADYVEEAAQLLRAGYLSTVDFGFKQAGGNDWRFRLRYTATFGGQLIDSRPGRLPAAASVAGLPFHSYLVYSPAFHALGAQEQAVVEAGLPVDRVEGQEPGARNGTATGGHGYGRNGAGVGRDVYVAIS